MSGGFMMLPNPDVQLSGERFTVVYHLVGEASEALDRARKIAVEQTLEFPTELLAAGPIRDQVSGRVESFTPLPNGRNEAVISYAVETTAFELPQLLNVVFGNSSLQPGVRVERIDLPETLLRSFRGPRYGTAGLRALLKVPHRPLLCTALKPMGLPAAELASLAYRFALGGIDIVKDDHGLADQPFAPFAERVARCAEAVRRANEETGRSAIYMPNVTAPADQVVERAYLAKQAGAGGLLVSPGLVGFDTMRFLADDDGLALPIMSHPAFLGGWVTHPTQGISHFALLGQLMRLAGADASVYPNTGGRFSFSREECLSIARGCATPMGPIRPIFPTPGGGMNLDQVPAMLEMYGSDVIFLIGGGLFRRGPDLAENARAFAALMG